MRQFHFTILIVLFAQLSSLSQTNQEGQSVRDIMVKVQKVSKESFISAIQKMKLSTCKYVVKENVMKCAEESRNTLLEIVMKNYGIDNKDNRSIAIIIEPKKDQGIGTLTYEYGDPDKDTESWIYLSALGKVKRLASSNEDNDESGSFFGSEFFLEDMEELKLNEYTFKILSEETYKERPVWVIEYTPNSERAKKSKYNKTISWIDKERYIILKKNLYRQGELYKQLTMANIDRIDNVWIARKSTMNNLVTRKVTTMEMISVAFNQEIPDELLTTRTLVDFAFREKNLTRLRAKLK